MFHIEGTIPFLLLREGERKIFTPDIVLFLCPYNLL